MTTSSSRVVPISQQAIAEAVEIWQRGGLVAFGTETVYGLGGDATSSQAVGLIFASKSRPDFNPLISHVATSRAAFAHASPTPLAQQLAQAFWPGPMTLVLDRHPDSPITPLASAGLPTIAMRVPRHPAAQDLLAAIARPIAAPSANPSGELSPTRAAHVATAFAGRPQPALIIDSGGCDYGVESTVIDARGKVPTILRLGSITADQISQATGLTPQHATRPATAPSSPPSSRPISPGQTLRHYAPKARLRLNAKTPLPDEAWLGFGNTDPAIVGGRGIGVYLNLSPRGDVDEAAANLFAMLHTLDATLATSPITKTIAIAPIPMHGVGVAINDRLRRAANQ